MRERRIFRGVLAGVVLVAGLGLAAPTASAAETWAPVPCVDANGDGFGEPPADLPPEYAGGTCATHGPEGDQYPGFGYVTCETRKQKTAEHEGILWERGNTGRYQCVAVPD